VLGGDRSRPQLVDLRYQVLTGMPVIVVVATMLGESYLAQYDRHRQDDQHCSCPHGFLPEFLCRRF
jgi:hypothetical protein